jgi:hypothetical protein
MEMQATITGGTNVAGNQGYGVYGMVQFTMTVTGSN